MRTEIKVGLIMALVLVAGGGIFWSLSRGGEPKADLPFDGRSAGAAKPVGDETPASPPAARDGRVQPTRATPPPSSPAAAPANPAVRPAATPAGANATTPPSGGSTPALPPAGSPAAPPASASPTGSTGSSAQAPESAAPGGTRLASGPPATPATTPPTTPANPPTSPGTSGERPAGGAAADTRTPTTPGTADKPTTPPPVNVPPRTAPANETPPRPAVTDKPTGEATYTVADLDTLSTIARATYGDSKYWPAIVAANPGINPDFIRVGQVLKLPPKEEVLRGGAKPKADPPAGEARTDAAKPASEPGRDAAKPADKPAPATPSNGRMYKVLAGDTLSSIARAVLNDENRWPELYELNRDRLASPDHVYEGMELRLPEK